MTVKELINELSEYQDDVIVLIHERRSSPSILRNFPFPAYVHITPLDDQVVRCGEGNPAFFCSYCQAGDKIVPAIWP
jgi:hypothetical protein